MSFIAELKRRNVFRVGIAYAVICWLLAQIAEFAFENFGAPEWVLKSFVVVLLLGLPVALIFAWAFEMTPEGIKLEKDVDRSQSITRETGRKLNRLIIGVLAAAVAILAFNQFSTRPADRTAEITEAATDRSIAVLPFIDLSADQQDEFFGRGMAEELLNALARFPDLRVAARTSAFSFAGRDVDLREVGESLGVAHVLEGSVRRGTDKIRVTAQLIRAADGMHLWSDTYDRSVADVLAIQDEIVGDISRALEIRLGVGAGTGRARQQNVDPRAYETYLQGLYLWSTRHVPGNRSAAIRNLRAATEFDPDFADAHAAYALALLLTTNTASITGIDEEVRTEIVGSALRTALELDPENARAWAGLAYYLTESKPDLAASAEALEKAATLAPNSALTHYIASHAAMIRADYETARRSMERTRLLDPLNQTIARAQAQHRTVDGNWGMALAYFDQCVGDDGCLSREELDFYALAAMTHMGQTDRALAALDRLIARNDRDPDPATSPEWQETVRSILTGEAVTLPEDMSAHLETATWLDIYWTHALIRLGRYEQLLDYMIRAGLHDEFWSGFSGQLLLSRGRFELPDEFRKYPGYRAFWDRDGWRELARARIANGHPEGLPLNEDGSLVEF